jgi:hypothetical protein
MLMNPRLLFDSRSTNEITAIFATDRLNKFIFRRGASSYGIGRVQVEVTVSFCLVPAHTTARHPAV